MLSWCEFCNSAPADGVLEAILVEGGTAEMFNICTDCKNDIPKENWQK